VTSIAPNPHLTALLPLRILQYTGLDIAGVAAQYRQASEAIAREDFRAAEVKKLTSLSQGKFYRAKLDGANRLLFALVRHAGETCALMLEVIRNHDYAKSRFLRGASIDETKIPDVDATAAQAEVQAVRYLHPERASSGTRSSISNRSARLPSNLKL
jgi:hypothetical protein